MATFLRSRFMPAAGLFFALLSAGASVHADPNAGNVTGFTGSALSPSANPTLVRTEQLGRVAVGQSVTLSWDSADMKARASRFRVRLELEDMQGDRKFVIQDHLPASGSHDWTVPWHLPPGNYQIRQTIHDLAGRDYGSSVSSTIAITMPRKSTVERYLNPFGDPWALAVDNPDLPLMGTVHCHRTLPEEFWAISQEQLAFVGNLDAEIYWGECTNLLTPPEVTVDEFKPQVVIQRIVDLKAWQEETRFLGYLAIGEWGVGSPGYGDIYLNRQAWFLHRAGEPATDETVVHAASGAPILDVTNPDFQDFVAQEIRRSLEDYNLDGFLADGVAPAISADLKIQESVRTGWQEGWIRLLRKVKIVIGPDKLVFANVNEDHEEFIRDILPSIDGVMLEDPLGSIHLDLEESRHLARFESAMRAAADLDKYVVNVVNTNVNGVSLETTSADQEHRFARYYLAAHLIFHRTEKTLLVYYTPSYAGEQFRSDVFFTDWNLRVGEPREPYQVVRDDVYFRRFEGAYVYLNNSDSSYEVVFGACCSLLTPEGKRVERYTMPSKTGMLFLSGEILQEIE